ncbi:hypothetical protein WA158_005628 [Blastocystis sp. Blastoise]
MSLSSSLMMNQAILCLFFAVLALAAPCGRFTDNCNTESGVSYTYVLVSPDGDLSHVSLSKAFMKDKTCVGKPVDVITYEYNVVANNGNNLYTLLLSDITFFISDKKAVEESIVCTGVTPYDSPVSIRKLSCTKDGKDMFTNLAVLIGSTSKVQYSINGFGNMVTSSHIYQHINDQGCPAGFPWLIVLIIICVILLAVCIFVYIKFFAHKKNHTTYNLETTDQAPQNQPEYVNMDKIELHFEE